MVSHGADVLQPETAYPMTAVAVIAPLNVTVITRADNADVATAHHRSDRFVTAAVLTLFTWLRRANASPVPATPVTVGGVVVPFAKFTSTTMMSFARDVVSVIVVVVPLVPPPTANPSTAKPVTMLFAGASRLAPT